MYPTTHQKQVNPQYQLHRRDRGMTTEEELERAAIYIQTVPILTAEPTQEVESTPAS